MNPWEEDWSGTSQKAPWEEDWSTQAPAPSPASTLRRVDILPPAENKIPKWAQSLPEFAQPLFADGEQKALDAWRERVAYEMRPGASSMEPTKAVTQEDIDRIAINRWEQAGRQAPKKDIGQSVAGLAGFADIATLGLSDEFAALAPFERTLMETGSLEKAGQAFGEARQDYKALQSDATQQRPFSTRAGQTAALLAPGAKGYTIGMQAAPKLVPASVAAAVAGKSVPARLARYGGRLAAMTGIGALDYGLYNFAAEAPNQARVAGTEMPGVGDRLQFAAEEAITPTGLVAAAVPAIGSLGYRAGRGVVTAGKNTIEDTIAATRAAPRPEVMAQGVPLPQLRFRGGSFTPADVRGRVDLNTPDPATGRTPRQIAIDRFLDEGFSPDEAERAVRLLSYDGRANVNEMLFEIDNNLQEIGLAVGRINRPGRKILEEEFKARNEGMFDEIRQAIRRAVGASGDDLEDFNETMAKKAKEQSADGYAAAYGKQVSDDTWQKITGLLGDTPDGLDAARKGAELARNSARRDPAKLEAARQLDELADVLGSGGVPQAKLSTVALDFLDRGLRRKVDVAVRQGDNAYAASLLDFRNALRGSGLDSETGLNIPRTIYAQYQAAAKAAEFGERAAGKAVSLRQLKQQFLQAQRAADQALEEGIGEGSGIIDEALMMGWVRGTEDLIERADNPGTLIRQLYGSERQRQKMLDMLRELPETASPGLKADVTKDRKALVGSRGGKADYKFGFNLSTGERVEGRVPVRSLFDRQRDMLESQRVTVAGSPTGQVGDAIANQVGDRQRAQKLLAFVQGIYQNPANFAARIIDQIGQPLLYQKDVNRELGELLSTRGREKLLSVIDEIRQRQLARSGGTPPAPGAPPRPPLSGPPAGGGTAAAGFGFNPFARRPAVPVTKESALAEAEAVIRQRAAAADSVPITRAATQADYDDAVQSAERAINRQYGQRFAGLGDATSPGNTADDSIRASIREELARVTLREQGLDASAIIAERNRKLGTNAQLRERQAARREAVNSRPDLTDDEIALYELEDMGVDVQGFARQAAQEQRLNMPVSEMTMSDIVNMAERYARAYQQKGGRGATKLEQIGNEIYVSARGNPTRSNGLPNALRTDLGNAAGGALGGGIMPLPSTGDPEQDMRNRLALMGGMAAVGAGGPRLLNAFAKPKATPRSPQQAMRAELPGSPEYEAAKAKGLDMSQAGRLARAQELGFDTNRVYYHGTRKNFDSFDPKRSLDGLGIHLGTTPDQADQVVSQGRTLMSRNPEPFLDNSQVMPLYARVRNPIRLPDMQDWEPERVARALRRLGIEVGDRAVVQPDDIVRALKKRGHDGIVYENAFEGEGGDSLIVFDPENIRSVHAAFDPDKAASPILTAGFGGRPPRKPPKDSPEAIRAGVQKIVDNLRATEQARPPGQLVTPRGRMRGAIVPPDRAAIRAAAQAARQAAMAEQVPPPLPVRPPSARIPTSGAPTPAEVGLMAGTGITGLGIYGMERYRVMQANQGR